MISECPCSFFWEWFNFHGCLSIWYIIYTLCWNIKKFEIRFLKRYIFFLGNNFSSKKMLKILKLYLFVFQLDFTLKLCWIICMCPKSYFQLLLNFSTVNKGKKPSVCIYTTIDNFLLFSTYHNNLLYFSLI